MATLSYQYPTLPQLVPPSPGSFYPSPSPSSTADKGSLPSLEYSQGQQPPFWAGNSGAAPAQAPNMSNASSSYSSPPLTATTAPAHTLPTPPTSDSEISKGFPISAREELANSAASMPPQLGGQVVVSEPTGVTSSAMLARRQNASLPAFSLPSSNTRNFSYNSITTGATTPSLLTPPSVGSDNLSPVQGGGSGLYSNMGYWSQPSPSPSSYSFGSSAGSSQSSYTTAPPMPNAMAYTNRNLYSPPAPAISSHKDRPATPGETATTPSTTYEGHSFQTTVVAPHLQYATGYGFPPPPNHSPSTGPLSPHDHFSPGSLPPPTPHPIYPHQGAGYPYAAAASGITSPNRPSTSTGIPQLHPHPIHPAPPPNLSGAHAHLAIQSRYLPGMPVSNAGLMSHHGSHLIPGSHHLGPALPHLHHSHGGHHTAVQQDRPFKCDQCPQSFNRNHDLKRHRRIHLAVKPFPCPNCDKSFSRKDALKRHVLVKGCGTTSNSTKPSGSNNSSGSPTRQSVSPLSS